jgi:hypothetical protein
MSRQLLIPLQWSIDPGMQFSEGLQIPAQHAILHAPHPSWHNKLNPATMIMVYETNLNNFPSPSVLVLARRYMPATSASNVNAMDKYRCIVF